MDRFNVDANIYSKESLRLLNIRDLRDIGRTFGVPSPTTKSKDELVEYILKILYGEVKGEVRNTRGRPNTRSFDMDKYVSEIKKRSIVKPDEFSYSAGSVDFSLKLASPSTNHTNNTEVVQRVFVKDEKGAYLRVHAFVESEQDIKVSNDLESKFELESFDMVEIIVADGLFKIVSINGKKIENKIENLEIAGHTFENGGYEVFHYGTKEEIKSQIEDVYELCKTRNAKMLMFSGSEQNLDDANMVCFNVESEDDSHIYKKLMQFIALVEKHISQNEDVVAVMTDADVIEKIVEGFDAEVSERTKKHLQSRAELFAKLGNVLLVLKLDKENVIY